MNTIIKNIDTDKIDIKNINNMYKLHYNYNKYFKLLGLTIRVNYKYITKHNNLYYIYFDEKYNDNIDIINKYLNKKFSKFLFIRNNMTNKFIICNNNNNIDTTNLITNNFNNIKNEQYIHINMNKIKYSKNNNIPIIHII